MRENECHYVIIKVNYLKIIIIMSLKQTLEYLNKYSTIKQSKEKQ